MRLLLVIFFFSLPTFAKLDIPKNLNNKDREVATEILGASAAMKLLGDPYPLGGFSGVELSVSSEYISTNGISRLGDKAIPQSETNYNVFSFGKGVYNNLDVYFQFGLLDNSENLSNFGGQIRWGFLEADYIPAYMSFVVSGNSVNYQNKIAVNNYGADIVAGVNVEDITVFVGGGVLKTQGLFMGGPNGITDDQNTHKENLITNHYLAGINVDFSNVFIALQIDRYSFPAYSGKLGIRF